MKRDKESETIFTYRIVCPYCGYEYDDSSDYADDDVCVMACNNCDEPFKLKVDIDITYSTYKAAPLPKEHELDKEKIK